MLKTCYHYHLFGPLRREYKDDGTQVMASCAAKFKDGQNAEIALIGDGGELSMLRISFLVEAEEISASQTVSINHFAERVITAVRLRHDPDAHYWHPPHQGYFSGYNFLDEGRAPNFNFQIHLSMGVREAGEILKLVAFSEDQDRVLRLYADAASAKSPVSHRYLCYIRILEIYFRPDRVWVAAFGVFVARYEAEFRALGVSPKTLRAFLMTMRDKCAHAHVGSASEPGVVSPDSSDGRAILQFLPLMKKIVDAHLNERWAGEGAALRVTQADDDLGEIEPQHANGSHQD